MTTQPVKHKLKINNASTMLLASILSTNGWAKTVEDIIVGGSLLVEVLGDFKPKVDGKDIDLEWAKEEAEYELTEKQRECCKRAIRVMVEQGKVPIGKPSLQLLTAFGLE